MCAHTEVRKEHQILWSRHLQDAQFVMWCWDPNSDTPDLSSHQQCLFLCLEFFFLLIAFLKKNNLCVSVWVYALEGRCPQKPEASDLLAAAVVGICELPDMGTGN